MVKIGEMKIQTSIPTEIHEMIGGLKDKIKNHIGHNGEFKHFEVVGYGTQIVAGTNYFVNIKITNFENPTPDVNGCVNAIAALNNHLHVRLFKGLDGQISIRRVLQKYHFDKLEYFE